MPSQDLNSITVNTVDIENLTVLNAGVKLSVSSIELAKGEAFTFYLTSKYPTYDFSDVTDITLKGTINSADFRKVTNRSFTLTTKAKTDKPEDVTVVLTSNSGTPVELTLSLTVKETTETVNAVFNKSLVDAYPGVTLPFTLTGTDGTAAIIESIVDENSPVKIDKLNKTMTIEGEGDFVQGLIVRKDNFTKTIYVQVTSSNVVKVHPTDVEIHKLQTAQLDIKVSGTDFNITSDKQNVCTVEKSNKTITPVNVGNAKVTVTGIRGTLNQVVNVNVVVRETIEATLPIIPVQASTMNGGDRLVLTATVAQGDKLVARVDGMGKGNVITEANKIIYTAHTPNDDEVVTLKVKTISKDDKESAEVDYRITVKGVPTTTLIVPDSITLKENETLTLDITTDAKSVVLLPSIPALLEVNSTTKTIKAKQVGTLTLLVKATAINMKPAEKVIDIVINPANLNKPILKTKVTQVESGKPIVLEFIIDPNSVISVDEVTGEGVFKDVDGKTNAVEWTAPDIGEYTSYHYNFSAKAVRRQYNLNSPAYDFQVLVIKPKDAVQPEEPDFGLAMDEVLSIVKDEKLTFKEKMDILKIQGNKKTREIINVLLDYEDIMKQNHTVIGDETGGVKNFELFTKLKYILELKENVNFQALFGIVNLVFREYRESAYAELNLHRFEDNWPSNNSTLMAYKGLVTAIYMLCDISTRESNMRRVDFNRVFNSELEVWKDYSVQSFTKYYTY